MQLYMRKNEFFPTERELEALFGMFDRDGDDRISYSEFTNYVLPKITVKQIAQPEKVPFTYEMKKETSEVQNAVNDTPAKSET